MGRAARILAWVVGIVVGLVVLAGVALFVMPWGWVRAPLDKRLSDASGRSIAVDGPLDVHLGMTTRVVANDVRVANAPWGSEPQMVTMKQLLVSIYLPDLLRGRVVLPELKLTQPKILLEKNKDGEANWHFANPKAKAVKTAAVPTKRTEVPIIEHLVIDHGRLAFKDPAKSINIDSDINTATGGDPAHQQVHLQGHGDFAHMPFDLNIQGGSILSLRDKEQPYPVKISANIGKTQGGLDGTMTNPLDLAGVDLKMRLSGGDLADIFPIFGIPIPSTPPYSLAGRLVGNGKTYKFQDFAGKVGASDLSGTISVTTGKPRPRMTAVLTSKVIDMKDLAGFVGASPGNRPPPNPNRVLPDTKINLGKLRSMDMDVHFNGRRVNAGALPIERLGAALKVENGRATLDPISFGVAHGKIEGTVVLDGSQDVPGADFKLQISQIDLKRFFHSPELQRDIAGIIGGRVDLAGKGRSTAEILGNSDGRLSVFMGQGQFSRLLVDLMGLEIGKALGVVASKGKQQTEGVRCMVADFGVDKGVMKTDTLVFDTQSSDITGKGTVNLGSEAIDLQLTAHPKHPSFPAATAPIDVGGTFKHPTFGVDAKAEAARTGAAAALGALLTPLGALLPFIDLGLGKDSPCAQLIEQAKTGAPTNQPQQAGTPPPTGNAQ